MLDFQQNEQEEQEDGVSLGEIFSVKHKAQYKEIQTKEPHTIGIREFGLIIVDLKKFGTNKYRNTVKLIEDDDCLVFDIMLNENQKNNAISAVNKE